MYVNGGSVIAIGVIFPVLGTIATILRFLARAKRHAGFKIDDWLCLPALAIVIASGALYIWGSVKKGIGYHSPPNQTLEEALFEYTPASSLILKIQYIINVINPVGTGLIRLSILFFYRRIFRGKKFDIVSWTMIGLTTACMISFAVAVICVCAPNIEITWTYFAQINAKCFNSFRYFGAQAIISFLLDLIILTIPFFWIWRLNMQNSQKWAVSSVFLVGLFTVAAGAVRMVAALQVMNYKWGIEYNIVGLVATSDTMGGVSMLLFWQYIEHGTGMVVCCLPTFKGLFTKSSETRERVQSWPWSRLQSRSSRKSSGVPPSEDSLEFGQEDEKEHITVTNTVHQYVTPSSPV